MKILVTGGASGLGEAITRKMAAHKEDKVYFTYCHSAEGAKKIQSEFSNSLSIKCDFTSDADVKALTNRMEELDPDLLINNAWTGGFIETYFHKTETEDFLNKFKANVLPTIEITSSAINVFRKKKSGQIITILTSALVHKAPIGTSVYVANKGYLRELTKAWATENIKFNITSNSVSPSFMRTTFTRALDERVVSQIIESHPLKKLLSPEEVAEAVYRLAGSSPRLNGTDIVLNSGMDIK